VSEPPPRIHGPAGLERPALLDSRREVETPEGIFLALAPAGIPARGAAFLVDFAIRLAAFIGISAVSAELGRFGTGLALIAFFAIEWLYPVAFELAPGSATPGKRLLGLRVVMDSGLPVTPAASLTRNLLRSADFLPLLYAAAAVSMLARSDFKRLGDLAAGTLVVHAEKPASSRAVPPAAPRPPATPLPARAQVAIVAWAERVARLTPARAGELAELAAPAIGAGTPADGRVPALLGVAHWLLGTRAGLR